MNFEVGCLYRILYPWLIIGLDIEENSVILCLTTPEKTRDGWRFQVLFLVKNKISKFTYAPPSNTLSYFHSFEKVE